jgi:hypothetical protein
MAQAPRIVLGQQHEQRQPIVGIRPILPTGRAWCQSAGGHASIVIMATKHQHGRLIGTYETPEPSAVCVHPGRGICAVECTRGGPPLNPARSCARRYRQRRDGGYRAVRPWTSGPVVGHSGLSGRGFQQLVRRDRCIGDRAVIYASPGTSASVSRGGSGAEGFAWRRPRPTLRSRATSAGIEAAAAGRRPRVGRNR